MTMATPTPVRIELKKSARMLCIDFADGTQASIGIAALRRNSPAADGKIEDEALDAALTINEIEPVGNYAIRPHFSDGHASGIYDWALLHALGSGAK